MSGGDDGNNDDQAQTAADDCKGTTAYLEPYIELSDRPTLKHLNYSGPGNPVCAEYQREHPPVKYIDGTRTHSDEIALAHDLAYNAAFREQDPIKRQRMIREADEEYLSSHERYWNEPAKLGYYGIKSKVIAESLPFASSIMGRYYGHS